MTFIRDITLTMPQIILVLLFCYYVVATGRPDWAAGVYLSTAAWGRSIMVGSVSHTYILMATMIGAAVVYLLKQPGKMRTATLLPNRDRWIVPWMAIWWMWMLFLIFVFRPSDTVVLLRSFLLYSIFPVPIVLLFAHDVRRARNFAIAYLLTTVIGGVASLSVLGIPLEYLRADPTLTHLGIIRLNTRQYHWVSYAWDISSIFIVALFLQTRHTLVRLILLVGAALCAYFLLLSGARDAIFAIPPVLFLFFLWALLRNGLSTRSVILLAGVFAVMVVSLYLMAPQLVLRTRDTSLLDAVNNSITGDRGELWLYGLNVFISSPLWGAGFTKYVYAHNFFIGTLSDQGLIGMEFLIGFLAFIARQAQGVWAGKGTPDMTIWRMAFACVILVSLLYNQVSGNPLSSFEIYWSSVFLWGLGSATKEPVAVETAGHGASIPSSLVQTP